MQIQWWAEHEGLCVDWWGTVNYHNHMVWFCYQTQSNPNWHFFGNKWANFFIKTAILGILSRLLSRAGKCSAQCRVSEHFQRVFIKRGRAAVPYNLLAPSLSCVTLKDKRWTLGHWWCTFECFVQKRSYVLVRGLGVKPWVPSPIKQVQPQHGVVAVALHSHKLNIGATLF